MKKRNLKNLALNKKQISTLNGGTTGWETIDILTVLVTNDSCNTDGGYTGCLPSEYRTACVSNNGDCDTHHCPRK